jgi:UDP-N-acetylglucosamine 1-carboxyvinyltransferase
VDLWNVPTTLNDVKVLLAALRHVGVSNVVDDGRVRCERFEVRETEIPIEISGKIRYSLLFLGLLLGKAGHAKIYLPGGCNLGERKFDLHLEGLRKLGADIRCDRDFIEARADKLVGTDIQFYLPTTSGTENMMIAACFAEGRTRIFNANTRPEVKNLGDFLNAMGANVTVKNRVVEIEAPTELHGCEFRTLAGWDEALTYIIGAALTGGELCVKDFNLQSVQHDVAILRQAGVDIFEWGGSVYASARNRCLKPFDLFTGPYPAVNSDMQPIFAAFASQCQGESSITDQRFTERFAYVDQLRKLGVDIENYGNSAIIKGQSRLKGDKVRALDLRCGAALVVASLKAEGITVIDDAYQIGRGYENVAARMNALGADIERTDE